MLLTLKPKHSSLKLWGVAGFHLLLALAPWLSGLDILIQVTLTIVVSFWAWACLRVVKTSNEISLVHFQESGCQLCLQNARWLPVVPSIVHCDRFLVIVKFYCLDNSFVDQSKHWQLWFYPGAIGAAQQRQLRGFIRSQFS